MTASVERYPGFHDFVAARSVALARTAYLLTGDHHAAEDLVQEALSRVVLRWTSVVAVRPDRRMRDTSADLDIAAFVAVDVDSGEARRLFTFSPRFPDEISAVSVAHLVVAGEASGTARSSRNWPGWYLDWAAYVGIGVGVLLLAIAAIRRATRPLRESRSAAVGSTRPSTER